MTQRSPSAHHRTNMSGCIFATKACIDNGKNFLNSNISSTCPHNIANLGPSLAAEIGSVVWGTAANSTSFVSCFRYYSDVAQRKPTKLCTMSGRLLCWYNLYTFGRAVITLGIGPHSIVLSPLQRMFRSRFGDS